MVEARRKVSTLKRSGRNRQKQDAKHACMEKETPKQGNSRRCKIRKEAVEDKEATGLSAMVKG